MNLLTNTRKTGRVRAAAFEEFLCCWRRGTAPFALLRPMLLIALCCAEGLAQCPAGGLAVVVNRANSTETLTGAQLRKVMLGDVRTWPDKKAVTLVNRPPGSEVYRCLLLTVVRMSDSEYRRFVLNVEFRGEEPVPMRTLPSAAAEADTVATLPGGIAIIEASKIAALGSSVKVVRINGKQPGEPGYPLNQGGQAQ